MNVYDVPVRYVFRASDIDRTQYLLVFALSKRRSTMN